MGPLLQMYVVLSALSFKFVSACQDGECRQLVFPGDFMFGNRRLIKHGIETLKVLDFDLCELQCYHQPNCVSINFNAIPNSEGLHECELNDATHRSHGNELMSRDGYVYKGAESACDRAVCKNGGTCQSGFTDKGYRCVCPPGFTSAHCDQDIDECSIANDCHQHATCHNTKGSYNCICKKGFKGDGRLNCTDIDECYTANVCHQNATCNNTKGSYNCTCKGGFKGDGRINCTEHRLQDSVIIGDNQTYFGMLSDWLKPVVQVNGQWVLCWRASLHGWAAATFHSLCDNKGPTITIVKDTNDNIFGGYTSISWQSSRGLRSRWCKNDSMAFLFSLKNPTNNPRKLPQIDNSRSCAVVHHRRYGPFFRGLYIPDHANIKGHSYEYLGYSYTLPSGKPGDPFLTGKNHFTASEIETFYETTQ